MSAAVVARAPGKVNLHFQVGPLRPDGYHAVASLYAAVDQLETVELRFDPQLRAGQIACELEVVPGSLVAQQQAIGAFDPALVPLDERNLAVRATRAALDESPALPSGLRLLIRKTVPVAGGMGGGSADAAAALSATAQLIARETGHQLTPQRLLEIGAVLGADVPFAMTGGAAVGTGTGTRLHPVAVGAPWHAVLIADTGVLSTPQVFGTLDRLRDHGTVPQRQEADLAVPAELLRALADGDPRTGAQLLANDLQAPALEMAPGLRGRLEQLQDLGARALVSGSGPTIVALPSGPADPATDRAADGAADRAPDGASDPSAGSGEQSDDARAAASLAQLLRSQGACAVPVSIG